MALNIVQRLQEKGLNYMADRLTRVRDGKHVHLRLCGVGSA